MAVWLIYMVDRTLDGFAKTETDKLSARHAFYRRNRKLIAWVAIPAAFVATVFLALTAIPAPIMWRGIILSFAVGIYLLQYAARRHRPTYVVGNVALFFLGAGFIWLLPVVEASRISYIVSLFAIITICIIDPWKRGPHFVPKEFVCGWVFAVGCSLSVNFCTMGFNAGPLSPEVLLLALLFALNCVAISCYERRTDTGFDANSISQKWPAVVRVYPLLLLTVAGIAGYMLQRHRHPELLAFTIAIFVSTALLAALHIFASRLRPDLSRVLADAALALPLVVLIVGFGA